MPSILVKIWPDITFLDVVVAPNSMLNVVVSVQNIQEYTPIDPEDMWDDSSVWNDNMTWQD